MCGKDSSAMPIPVSATENSTNEQIQPQYERIYPPNLIGEFDRVVNEIDYHLAKFHAVAHNIG
jgi:hypothetical protein